MVTNAVNLYFIIQYKLLLIITLNPEKLVGYIVYGV